MKLKSLSILLLLLSGCKSASELTYKAISKDRAKVAEITRKEWPCVTVKSDTSYRTDTITDIITVQCPDTIAVRIDSFGVYQAVKVPVYIKVPVEGTIQTITVTKTIEDSAKITVLQTHVDKLKKTVSKKSTFVAVGWSIAGVLFLLLVIAIILLLRTIKKVVA
mgnify:CR=1 FL=1